MASISLGVIHGRNHQHIDVSLLHVNPIVRIKLSVYIYEQFRKKIDIIDSAQSTDQDQLKHTALANPGRHFSSPVDFLFHESLLYTSIPLRRNVSAGFSLR